VSVPSNIVEGCSRDSLADYIRFLDIAYASARELDYQISLAHRLTFLSDDSHSILRSKAEGTCKVLNGLIRSLRAPKPPASSLRSPASRLTLHLFGSRRFGCPPIPPQDLGYGRWGMQRRLRRETSICHVRRSRPRSFRPPSPPKTDLLRLASFRGRGEPNGARKPVISAAYNVAISGVYPKSFCLRCFAVDRGPFDWLDDCAELSLHCQSSNSKQPKSRRLGDCANARTSVTLALFLMNVAYQFFMSYYELSSSAESL